MKKTILKTMFLSVVAILALSFTQQEIEENTGYKVGDSVTDFSLKNVDGKMVKLADYKDAKGFIVVFTCNHCPYAIKYENRINELNKKYADKGYPVIAINPNDAVKYPTDSYDSMVYFAKEKGFTFPYLHDETQEIAKAFGAAKTPHTYVISNKKGKLTVEYIGAIDDNYKTEAEVKEKYVEAAVDALLANKKVKVTTTKAIGCGIKWKK